MGGHGREYETAFRRMETSKKDSFVVLSRSAADMQRIFARLVSFAVSMRRLKHDQFSGTF